MSRAFKLLLVLGFLGCAGAAVAQRPVSRQDCTADVCSFVVWAKTLIAAPCQGYSVNVAYSKTNGATLIQCSEPASSQSNKSLIYDRANSEVKSLEISGWRFIRPEAFEEIKNGIPDKFATVPLCPATKREAPQAGQLMIAKKEPGSSHDSENAPYCYRLGLISEENGGLRIRTDDGKELPPGSETAAAKWAKLVENLKPYLNKTGDGASEQRSVSVVSDKAQLFTSPSSEAMSKMYLVKGDKVEVLDKSKIGDGWCLVRYTTKSAKVIDRWMQAHDLDIQVK